MPVKTLMIEEVKEKIISGVGRSDVLLPYGQTVFFIGAGFSQSAGIPLASEMVRNFLLEDYNNNICESNYSVESGVRYFLDKHNIKRFSDAEIKSISENPGKIYNLIFSQGLSSVESAWEFVKSQIDLGSDACNIASLGLGTLVSSRMVSTIITTNFDYLALEGCVRMDVMPFQFHSPSSMERAFSVPKHPQILWVHGSLSSYFLVNQDDKIIDSFKQTRDKIVSIFRSANLVVVCGYSANDDVYYEFFRDFFANNHKTLVWVSSGGVDMLGKRANDILSSAKDGYLLENTTADKLMLAIIHDNHLIPSENRNILEPLLFPMRKGHRDNIYFSPVFSLPVSRIDYDLVQFDIHYIRKQKSSPNFASVSQIDINYEEFPLFERDVFDMFKQKCHSSGIVGPRAERRIDVIQENKSILFLSIIDSDGTVSTDILVYLHCSDFDKLIKESFDEWKNNSSTISYCRKIINDTIEKISQPKDVVGDTIGVNELILKCMLDYIDSIDARLRGFVNYDFIESFVSSIEFINTLGSKYKYIVCKLKSIMACSLLRLVVARGDTRIGGIDGKDESIISIIVDLFESSYKSLLELKNLIGNRPYCTESERAVDRDILRKNIIVTTHGLGVALMYRVEHQKGLASVRRAEIMARALDHMKVSISNGHVDWSDKNIVCEGVNDAVRIYEYMCSYLKFRSIFIRKNQINENFFKLNYYKNYYLPCIINHYESIERFFDQDVGFYVVKWRTISMEYKIANKDKIMISRVR